MALTTTSITLGNVAANIINAVKSFLPIVCGVPESALTGVSDRYVLELSADLGGEFLGFGQGKHEFTVHAYLQEKFSISVGSTWTGVTSDIPGFAQLQREVDTFTQGVFGISAIATVSTQRKWSGSDPLTITFKLKFEAMNDPYTEVILPCIGLQALTLPRGGLANMIGLIPPGPSPFTFTQKGQKIFGKEWGGRGENISINIGNFIGFESVIVKSAKVTYDNRMSDKGPIGAEVDLTIETWRMLTREELQDAYKQRTTITSTNAIGVPTIKALPVNVPGIVNTAVNLGTNAAGGLIAGAISNQVGRLL